MSYLALYRKYRPVDFDNVYGQEEVVTVIKNAINNNMVSHAYLFCGPRGTGKTTIAKIIARMVNCENLINGWYYDRLTHVYIFPVSLKPLKQIYRQKKNV